jgi:AICAR transformylase/IMP cyclohydrolase PurH
MMLEDSAYAAISEGTDYKWDAVLHDTPYTREDFLEYIQTPVRLTAFSDAFFPKLDGFVEATGIDRINPDFGARRIRTGKAGAELFIPKRNNYNENYHSALIPVIVVQPGGSLGDKVTIPIAEKYNIMMVFTMDKETFAKYQAGKKATGRRFFGHNTMQ